MFANAKVGALALLLPLLLSCASAGDDRVVGVCEVIANPGIYDGRRVAVRGVVDTDYFEYSGFTDTGCFHRVMSFGPENQVRVGLQEFLSELQSVRASPSARVEVTAIGYVRWRPGEVPYLVMAAEVFEDIETVAWTSPTPSIP